MSFSWQQQKVQKQKWQFKSSILDNIIKELNERAVDNEVLTEADAKIIIENGKSFGGFIESKIEDGTKKFFQSFDLRDIFATSNTASGQPLLLQERSNRRKILDSTVRRCQSF